MAGGTDEVELDSASDSEAAAVAVAVKGGMAAVAALALLALASLSLLDTSATTIDACAPWECISSDEGVDFLLRAAARLT